MGSLHYGNGLGSLAAAQRVPERGARLLGALDAWLERHPTKYFAIWAAFLGHGIAFRVLVIPVDQATLIQSISVFAPGAVAWRP